MPVDAKAILGLDVGERRIGVALADGVARLASPLTVIENDKDVIKKITDLVDEHDVGWLVVGLPYDINGYPTAQTAYTRDFIEKLKKSLKIKIYEQDEALTSHQAEEELESRRKAFSKGDIDSLAATYILEDFITEHEQL